MQLTEKELSSIKALLSGEELLVKKFQMLAEQAEEQEVKDKMMSISNKHQEHFNKIYQTLGNSAF